MKSVFLILCCFSGFSLLFGQTQIDEKSYVKQWVESHPEVKIVSQSMYKRYNSSEKEKFNLLPHTIVYQSYLTKQDIIIYENKLNSNENVQSVEIKK
jgi:hypothetical protein